MKKNAFFYPCFTCVQTCCFVFFISLFHSLNCASQQIERKIILDKGVCYYTTIDPEFQIATLYACDLNLPLKSAKKLVLPAGRNFNIPVIPFCWDIAGRDLFAISFMNNARSNRREAIKRIPLRSLHEWDERTTISDVVNASADYPPYVDFEPYGYIVEKSNVLDHFFFDILALSDSSLCMAISNNSELSPWQCNNGKWSRGKAIAMEADDFFSLFSHKSLPYIILSDGRIYALMNNELAGRPEKKINVQLKNVILIINKMNDTVSFIDAASVDEKKSMQELMKNAIPVF